jgi:hypothetical protein
MSTAMSCFETGISTCLNVRYSGEVGTYRGTAGPKCRAGNIHQGRRIFLDLYELVQAKMDETPVPLSLLNDLAGD